MPDLLNIFGPYQIPCSGFGTFIFKEGFVIGDTGYSSALSTLALLLALLLSVVQITVLGSRLSPQTRKPAA